MDEKARRSRAWKSSRPYDINYYYSIFFIIIKSFIMVLRTALYVLWFKLLLHKTIILYNK